MGRGLASAAVAVALAAGVSGARAQWSGVDASRRPGGAVLLFREDEARLSADGDAPFAVVAQGDPRILDGAVGGHGSWALLREGSSPTETLLEVHDRRGAVRRHRIADAVRVAMAEGVVAVTSYDGLHVSTDAGRTFTLRPAPEPCKGCGSGLSYSVDVDISAAGNVVMADTEINTCTSADILEWQRRLVARRGGTVAQSHIQLPRTDYAAQFQVGAHGWLYGVTYARRLVAVGSGGPRPVHGVAAGTLDWHLLVAHNGRITLALVGGQLVRLAGDRAVPLGPAPTGAYDLAVDGRGRALALTEAGLFRFSRRTGWTSIVENLAPP